MNFQLRFDKPYEVMLNKGYLYINLPGVTLDHGVGRLEAGICDLGNRQLFMIGLLKIDISTFF